MKAGPRVNFAADAASPLAGLRVLDFTQALAGPFCTMILGDMGADVIKVEEPSRGDDSRSWGPPFMQGTGTYYLSANRNKRSIALNLKSEQGRATACALAAQSDIVVENWRPGTATRLGVGPELRERYPSLIYCSISAFGADGDARPGYDQVIQGMSGWMSLTGPHDGPPYKVGLPVADIASGMFATLAIAAVAREREITGQGRFVDIAMLDSLASMLSYQACVYFATGRQPVRSGNMHATIVPFGACETADGIVNVTCGNDKQWQNLCAALGAKQLATDERFRANGDRVENSDALYRQLFAYTRDWTSEKLIAALDDAGVPAGPVWDLPELFESDEARRRGLRQEVPHPKYGTIATVGQPWRIDGVGAQTAKLPPEHGEHTTEILAWLAAES